MNPFEKLLRLLKLLYMLCIVLAIIIFPISLFFKPLLYVTVVYVVLIFMFYFAIHILRSKIYEYTCPKCNHKFGISFTKDITSFNSGADSKVLVCPNCCVKEIMKQNLK